MAKLKKLQSADSLHDLAKILDFTPKGLSYIVYTIDNSKKYRSFDIPKKAGGTRQIKAPIKPLRLLQTRLADLLYSCVREIQQDNPGFWVASHGFVKGRTIVSNAHIHRGRNFVFNIDIEDFFGSINFGRVRGFFIKDNIFKLDPAVATVIAQIACHDNALPQGSPSSPVISNLIGNILDSRLLALAKSSNCTYTRYADDITFSTNEKTFPSAIANEKTKGVWEPGKRLTSEIHRAGFAINDQKTRMTLSQSRQVVTGLVVNKKANIDQTYYRTVRAMCHSVFYCGKYYRPPFADDKEVEYIEDLNPLEGMLSHIYFVKERRDRKHKTNRKAIEHGEFLPPKAPKELYRKFLFFKHFVVAERPLIVTEGVSDIIYLKCAIKALAGKFPSLIQKTGSKPEVLVNFLKPTGNTRDVLNLGHGSSGQAHLIERYNNQLKKYTYRPLVVKP